MTGTGVLVRLILRRDRVLMPLWVVILGVLPAGYAVSFAGLFPTAADRVEYARVSMDNAGFLALLGPLRGSSLGELVAWRAGFLPVIIGLISLLTVIRHTRADEEAGRTELIGAGVVDRRAPLAAALLTTIGANLVLALVTALTLIARGLPAPGSTLLAAGFALSGCVLAAVGAVAAQLTGSARTARAIALLTLGAGYVLRLTDLAWLSPFDWVQHVFPYGQSEPFFPLLTFLAAVLVTAVAALLVSRRDLGAGLLPERSGRASAGPALNGPFGLAWRLHRGVLAGWVAGLTVLGLVLGAVTGSVAGLGDVFERLHFQQFGGVDPVDGFLSGMVGMLGLIAAAYAVQATLRLRDEEAAGHAELVLATGRLRWAASHLVFSLLGPAVALLAGGAACGLAAGLATGDVGHEVPAVLGGAAAQLPAVWVLAALTVLLLGVLPRQSPAVWGILAACLLILLAGPVLRLDQWVLDLSPFTHLPHLPGGPVSATPLVTLTALAVVLTATGLAGLRRRDIPSA
ncbi:ABC transporter permease [Actinoplanes sp. NPDC051494]|uniref:ABC transporter permease n=1 Tax=Actinoplanes sp. NPDC051494 TaxID=3363907 RepID=UPI0037AC0436